MSFKSVRIGKRNRFVFLWVSIVFFLLTVGFTYFFITKENTNEKNAELIRKKLSTELQYIEPMVAEISSTLLKEKTPSFNMMLKPSRYPYYVFSKMGLTKRVVFWSNNLFTPKYRDILGDFRLAYVENNKGSYIARKEPVINDEKAYEIVFLIPLAQTSAVVNEYLKNTYNENIFTDSNFEVQETPTEEYQQISIDGKDLFAVKFGNAYNNFERSSNYIVIALLTLSFLFLGIYIKKQTDEFVRQNRILTGFLFLISCIVVIRGVMLLFRFPQDFVYIDLFDPRHYGSTLVNPSLGDLMLNLLSLLFLGMYIFNNFLRSGIVRKMLSKGDRSKVIMSGVAFFMSFFWLAVHHQTMKTLNVDSQWSMDISQQLEFDYLKVIGYALFFISVVVYFLFSHISFRLVGKLTQRNRHGLYLSALIGIFLFILFSLVLRWDFEVIIIVNLLFFLVINYFKLPRYIGKIQYLTFIYFFSFGLPGAVIGVYANYQYNRDSSNFSKSRMANQLLVERNFFTELQLQDVAEMIKEDIFIQKRIFSPYASKLIIEKKIRREYLNNLDKFDIQIYVFNSRGEPFEQFNMSDNYFDFESRLSEFKTEIDGLYFINQAGGQATSRYLYFIEMVDRNQVIGHILLDLRQKRLVPNSVFPLLLNENPETAKAVGTEQFSYGVFLGRDLQYNYGEFNYRKNLESFIEKADLLFDESVNIKGYNHKAFLGEGNRFVIVSSKIPPLESRFANFSFLFLIYVFTILLILVAITLYQRVRHVKLNYSAKIQLYLNFAFFTPLIIVSITTVSIIVQTFKTSLETQYVEFAENLSTKIAGPLNDYLHGDIEKEDLSDEIYQMAEIADLDINVFYTNGILITSSLFQIYQNEILSNNIEPRAFIKIIEESESAFVLEETVGQLVFKNAYVGIRSYESGEIIGILSLPFFASQRDLELNIVEVLSNIINIFTFVFIIFLFVSFFVSRGLTFPLRLITQKIKRTSLSSFNEPLSWNSDDEIGLMVSEYNRMLVNLESSKQALAKSEKESAWREMAQQVAHEIKNPLTPMKLTLQHMKRVIDDGGDTNGSEQKRKQINTLLEQIETLSDIAASFSDFAQMPTPQREHLDISILLRETIELYNRKELGRIVSTIEPGTFMTVGDRKWLGRAFSNLIINAFQAVNDQKKAKVEVKLFSVEKDKVRIEIKDNGGGIPEHIRNKVFTPNFSTKYTGSGLGLAITKKGIEHAGGSIWFSSKEGFGTVFYIELPRA